MYRHLPILMLLFILGHGLPSLAQNMELQLAHHAVGTGDTIEIEVTTANFDTIVSVQFSVNWDPSVIQYLERKEMDLSYVAVGETDKQNGNLRVSWFDIEGDGETLEEGKGVIAFRFVAIGKVGDYTDLTISGSPLEIQVNNNFDPDFLTINNGSVTIEEAEMVSVMASLINVGCSGMNNGAIDIAIEGNGTYSFLWNGPNNFQSNEPDITNLEAGEYTLSVLDNDGISVLDTLFVITEPLSVLGIASLETDTTDCDKPNGSVFITATGGTSPYTYDIGFGEMNQNIIAGLAAGSYSLTITDANDCTTTETFFIIAPDSPSLDLGEDIAICEKEDIILEGGAFDEYLWSTGSTDPELVVSVAGTYSLTITDERDCTAIDSVQIDFIDAIDLVLETDSLNICPGDSVQIEVSGGNSLEWIDHSASLQLLEDGTAMARPTESTNYQVVASNLCGSDTLMIPVAVFQIAASAGQDTCIAAGTEVQLNASGGDYYYWIGGDYPLSNYDIPNPFSQPDDSTSYVVMIIDKHNCTTFDTVTVVVATNPLSFIKHINMLTPNGDGANDVLDFGNLVKYGPNTLRVFNRWGDIVYEEIDYQHRNNLFDGTYKGKPLPAGNYYYVLAFRDNETLKQTLTIVRE